jgi:hypothetical protein
VFDARSSVRRVVKTEGWVAIGDALMACDPLYGRGVLDALSSGIEVADWLSGGPEEGCEAVPAWIARASTRLSVCRGPGEDVRTGDPVGRFRVLAATPEPVIRECRSSLMWRARRGGGTPGQPAGEAPPFPRAPLSRLRSRGIVGATSVAAPVGGRKEGGRP